jgi:hypothetical protein
MHAIFSAVDEARYPFPVLVLFVKPTIESSLCLDAFINSKGNKHALEALFSSETLKKVKGFPAEHLKALIRKELALLSVAKL